MSFSREGIEDIRTCVLPDAIAGSDAVAFSRSLLVTWRSILTDHLYQVYIDGRLAGVTIDPDQRRLVVQTFCSPGAAPVDVVAVAPAEAHIDFADQVHSPAPNPTRLRLTLLRRQDFPLGSMVNVYFDNGSGTIDTSRPLNETPLPVWPCWQDKAGLGFAQFGVGDFGYDAAAAVGLGKGSFGHGPFGLDADVIEWVSRSLPLGQYRVAVRVCDAQGNESDISDTATVTIVPPAQPAAALEVVTFDEQANQLILSISD